MKILLTNDDGVQSPGLWALAEKLVDLGEVTVIAPDRDQSGVGASMTLLEVVRAGEVESRVAGVKKTYAVEGTPADCVILATETLVSHSFDLVVSGINQGANLGLDIMTSGTVGAAFQGYFRKIPSIAVSVASLTDVQYQAAAQATAALAGAISEGSAPSPLFLNVNLPNVTPDKIQRVEITRLGPRAYIESVERGNDGRRTHYWIKHNKPTNFPVDEGTDIWAVRNNCVSITPMNGIFDGRDDGYDFAALAEAASRGLGLNVGS